MRLDRKLALTAVFAALVAGSAHADPCGMVPPVYLGDGPPITRVGAQKTYVFYKGGIEAFVIRPGFSGKVDEFGMLIPFPKPPAIRKVPDHIFPHIAAGIDPPEVVIDLTPVPPAAPASAAPGAGEAPTAEAPLRYDTVKVLRQEAVGMYEVAVLAAGSAQALKRWMDQHGYRYPQGMDKPCNDYVRDGWCFVAVKTKVGSKGGADPKPGQREARTGLPKGSSFDGNVQAMGFRFPSKELVVPMRLSAFNAGKLRNIVYILTDSPRKVRSIPEEYVVRQIKGEQLYTNLTGPLPLRIIGGTAKDLGSWHHRHLKNRRDPEPKNGAAKELFASDLLAVSTGELSLEHEEQEKELLAIGERLGLRGGEIDKINTASLEEARKKIVEKALGQLKSMTLTVVDGDFPREVLASRNLTFGEYDMPARRNGPRYYDARRMGPNAPRRDRPSVLIRGELKAPAGDRNAPPPPPPGAGTAPPAPSASPFSLRSVRPAAFWLSSLLAVAVAWAVSRKR